jgi:hypothetical protein
MKFETWISVKEEQSVSTGNDVNSATEGVYCRTQASRLVLIPEISEIKKSQKIECPFNTKSRERAN